MVYFRNFASTSACDIAGIRFGRPLVGFGCCRISMNRSRDCRERMRFVVKYAPHATDPFLYRLLPVELAVLHSGVRAGSRAAALFGR